MDIKERLEDLYHRDRDDLPNLPWMSEADRWAELAFCLLHSRGNADAQTARAAVAVLHAAGALQAAALGPETEPLNEAQVVVSFVLKEHGSAESADKCSTMLRHIASAVNRAFSGKMQRFLRKHSEPRGRTDWVMTWRFRNGQAVDPITASTKAILPKHGAGTCRAEERELGSACPQTAATPGRI